MNRLFVIVSMLVFSAGCAAESEPAAAPAPRLAEVEPAPPLPADHPVIEGLDVLSRGPRRMSVDQLERSIEAFGGLEPGSIVIPSDLAITLGKPDYLQTTEENLEPTPLFMKFMMDLGAIICPGLVAADAGRPAEQRVFTRYPDLNDNLRRALVLATGIEGEQATEYVPRLTRVFEAARQGPRGLASGYEAVCIALMTSPEFLLY